MPTDYSWYGQYGLPKQPQKPAPQSGIDWLNQYRVEGTGEKAGTYTKEQDDTYRAALANNPDNRYIFDPELQRKSAVERQNILSAAAGLEGLQRLYSIIQSGGLTPQQRAMFAATMNRNLGAQAEQSGQGLGRRFAAQGIGGTGLANSVLGQIQSGMLGAQQQADEDLNQKSLDLYLGAIQSVLGQNQFLRNLVAQERTAAKDRKAANIRGIFGAAKDTAETVTGGE